MEGIVAKIEDNQILIVEGVTAEEIEVLSEQEIIKTAKSAIYFELKQELGEIQLGDNVRVSFDSLDTSNPGYGVSNKIEILE